MMIGAFELGLNSFGEVASDGDRVLDDAETLRLTVEEARVAESVGLDVFSVGEHYREGHNDSATPVLLAARGFYAPDRERYEAELDTGALFVGSPETVANKIARVARDLRLSRFDLKYDIMHLPREARARTIELLGRRVAPRVQELLAKEPTHV
jgi:alkanesulfonate monooxygenase SsuD/methylene tetrahydromethanopterin reductase-like flavin-dependent oxidoreductase (luciferase family)